MSIGIILADDHKIMREGLHSLLDNEPDIEVLAEAADGRTAIDLARELHPGIIIFDVAMPEMNGVEATRRIVADFPGIKVIGLSMHTDRRFVTEMLCAGASGYLLKDCAFDEFARAVRAVAAGETYLSPSITGVFIDDYISYRSKCKESNPSILSSREREVLQLLAEGKSTKQIAATLHLSVKTIETHRQNIMRKLDAHSVAELTKHALREGLTGLE